MSGALTWARLSYRQQRWELILVALGVGAAALAMAWVGGQLGGMRAANPDCLGALTHQGLVNEPSAACQAIFTAYYDMTGKGDLMLSLAFGAPFGMGVLLGAPLVAREIDGATAQLAWSLGRSRTYWLLRRIAFIVAFAVVLLGVLAAGSEILAAALAPDRNLSADFAWIGRRGWLIVARGAAAVMLGILVGAVIGRVLPSILAAALVIALAFTGISLGMDRWLQAEALAMRISSVTGSIESDAGALVIAAGVETPDGTRFTWEQAHEQGFEAEMIDEQGRLFASAEDMAAGRVLGYDIVFAIPGARYANVVAQEAAVAGALGLVALGLTALVVRRRRPV